jgi:hypothetical protein
VTPSIPALASDGSPAVLHLRRCRLARHQFPLFQAFPNATTGILAREPHHQFFDLGFHWRSPAGSTSLGTIEFAGDKVAIPGENGVGPGVANIPDATPCTRRMRMGARLESPMLAWRYTVSDSLPPLCRH